MENQVTSKTPSVSHWSIFEGVSNIDQWLTEGVLLVTWISNIDYWKTGNQQINVDLVNDFNPKREIGSMAVCQRHGEYKVSFSFHKQHFCAFLDNGF